LDRDGLRDVCRKLSYPTEALADPDDTNALTPDELRRFLDGWKGKDDEAMINVLAYTGQRWAHVSALVWSDLHAAGCRVKMTKSHVRQHIAPANRIKRVPGWCPLPEHVV